MIQTKDEFIKEWLKWANLELNSICPPQADSSVYTVLALSHLLNKGKHILNGINKSHEVKT